MNNIVIAGHVGGEVKTINKGCAFSVAVNRYTKEVDWFDCVAFGKTSEFCLSYLGKGALVAVSGRMESRKVDGKTYWSVVANDVRGLGKKEEKDEDPFED